MKTIENAYGCCIEAYFTCEKNFSVYVTRYSRRVQYTLYVSNLQLGWFIVFVTFTYTVPSVFLIYSNYLFMIGSYRLAAFTILFDETLVPVVCPRSGRFFFIQYSFVNDQWFSKGMSNCASVEGAKSFFESAIFTFVFKTIRFNRTF